MIDTKRFRGTRIRTQNIYSADDAIPQCVPGAKKERLIVVLECNFMGQDSLNSYDGILVARVLSLASAESDPLEMTAHTTLPWAATSTKLSHKYERPHFHENEMPTLATAVKHLHTSAATTSLRLAGLNEEVAREQWTINSHGTSLRQRTSASYLPDPC